MYVYPDCHTTCLAVAEGAPKVIFSSGTVFLCLKTNRSICEMEKEKPNNCNEISTCFQTLLPTFGGLGHLCSTHQPLPNLAHDHSCPRQDLAETIIYLPMPVHLLLLVWGR